MVCLVEPVEALSQPPEIGRADAWARRGGQQGSGSEGARVCDERSPLHLSSVADRRRNRHAMTGDVEPHLGEGHAEHGFKYGLLARVRQGRGRLALPPSQLPDAHRGGDAELGGFLPERLDERLLRVAGSPP